MWLLSRSKVTKSRNMIQLPHSCDVTLILRENQWAAMWLVFWVISNVTTGFYSLDLAPAFYNWGYAWPVHNRKLLSHHLFLFASPQSERVFMAKLKINSCRSIAPSALRPALAHRSQCRRPCPLVRCQYDTFCAGVLLDALGAAES